MRKHERIWPNADKRARCDEICLRESDTCQHDAALHANTKELGEAQTNGHAGIWLIIAECRWLPKTLIAHTHLLTCRTSFERFFRSESFRDEKIWFLLRIAAIQDYRQRQSVGKMRFSWFTLHRPWLFLCVSLAHIFVSLCVIFSPESWK